MVCNSSLGNNICNVFSTHHLSQINKLPSRSSNDNILDTVLTNFPQSVSDAHLVDPVFHSDHKMFEFKIQFKPLTKKKEANFEELNFRIVELNLTSRMEAHGNNGNNGNREIHPI